MSRKIIIDNNNNLLLIPIGNKNKEIIAYAKADIDDYDKLKDLLFTGYKSKSGKMYAKSHNAGKIHKIIMGKAPINFVIDHINHDGLDNRKSNLRFATSSQNAQNRTKIKGKYTSDYTGAWKMSHNKWRSNIQYKSKSINIGVFNTEIEAAKSYDEYAIHYYGIHCKTNNLLSDEEIQNILNNGVKSYKIKQPKTLPKNITLKNGKYECSVQRNKKRIRKYEINTLDEAIKIKKEMIENLENEMKDKKPVKKLTKNKNGEAVIYLKNKDGDVIGETIVDEHLWFKLSNYSWYLAQNEYVQGYVNGNHLTLHKHLYTTYIGEIPKNMSIDHINRQSLCNKLENLRTASKSLQQHNQKKKIGSICHYKGVAIGSNKFRVNFSGQLHSFKYAEDAANKYNELAKIKYGDCAYQNEVLNTKTTVDEYYIKEITLDYIISVDTILEIELIIKKKGWGKQGGAFYNDLNYILKIENIEKYKEKAMELLRNEQANNNLNMVNRLCSHEGMHMHGDKFVVSAFGQRSSFDYLEDAMRKYNELLKERHGNESKLHDVPDTKTRLSDIIPSDISAKFIENIKYASILKQIVKKKKWAGVDGYFNVKKITSQTLEDDKKRAIILLGREKMGENLVKKRNICNYKGVYVGCNEFVVKSFGVCERFKYMKDAARKYNELAFKKYGDIAELNIVSDIKTTTLDLIPDNVSEEFIKNIKNPIMLKILVKKKKWGGKNGYFVMVKMSPKTLEDDKKLAIILLGKENNGEKVVKGHNICNYKGVSIHNKNFSVRILGTYESFEYMEDAARKYNELAVKNYGDKAKLNIVPDTKTTTLDLIPDNVSEEFIENIKQTIMFKLLIKKKKWGGKKGHFLLSKIKPKTLENYKKKAIEILLNEKYY